MRYTGGEEREREKMTRKLPIGKLPIGIQSFESMRKDGCVYVGKTAYISTWDNDSVKAIYTIEASDQ